MNPTQMASPPLRPHLFMLLGLCQMIAFGTSLYLLTTLAQPIALEMLWPPAWIVAGFTIGILAAGAISPWIGRLITTGHGRRILACSSLMFALGLGIIGLSWRIEVYVAGWLILGMGMACGLYDACFGTLGRVFGQRARRIISVVALIGGLASTVFWPASQYLATTVGWRETCFIFAALHLLICLPIYLLALPDPMSRDGRRADGRGSLARLAAPQRQAFWLFGAVMVIESGLAAMVAVHLVAVLGVAGVEEGQAAVLGALIGPSQIAVRLADSLLGHRIAPAFALLFSSVAITLGLVLLGFGLHLPSLAMVLYGIGIGLFAVTRGTFPLSTFGGEDYPALMGLISRPALILQAAAPLAASLIVSGLGADTLLSLLTALAALKIVLSLSLLRTRRSLLAHQA